MSKASQWTIRTRFTPVDGSDPYDRSNNLAVLMGRLGLTEDLSAREAPEVQEIIQALADAASEQIHPCVVEAYHQGNLLLASTDQRAEA